MTETNLSERELRAELDTLRQSEEQYRTIFEESAEGMALIEPETNAIVAFNRLAHEHLDYPREEFAQLRATDLKADPASKEYSQHIEHVLENGVNHVETIHRTRSGDERIVYETLKKILLEGRDYFLAMWRDITEQKQMEESIYVLSLVDELTGLYNRRGFVALAEQQRRLAERTKRDMFLVFADVDRLKAVNDKLGHTRGDMLLIDTANALRRTFRNSDITARIGGDEFVALLLQADGIGPNMVRDRLKKIISAINAEREDYQLSLSIGIIHYDPQNPRKLHELLHEADQAMYEEKRAKQD